MPDTISQPSAARPFVIRLFRTPLSHLLRGRVTGEVTKRLNWKKTLAASGLPTEAQAVVRDVTRRTRLWRREQASVAAELTAHFADGLAGGQPVGDLIGSFGDAKQTARLIRRAKVRGRSVVWHAWRWLRNGASVLLCVYAFLFARFWWGRPTVSVDYLARLNAPVLTTKEDDKAWPLYRSAHARLGLDDPSWYETIKSTRPDEQQDTYFLGQSPRDPRWPDLIARLNQHVDALALIRQAGDRQAFGFEYESPAKPDAAGNVSTYIQQFGASNPPFLLTLLPYVNDLRALSSVMLIDAEDAGLTKDRARLMADLRALAGMSRHLRSSFLLERHVALEMDAQRDELIAKLLRDDPTLFTPDMTAALAHLVSRGVERIDLIDAPGDRMMFDDFVQRLFTDDGNGDGRLTASGNQTLMRLRGWMGGGRKDRPSDVMAVLPIAGPSRREFVETYERFIDRAKMLAAQSYRTAAWKQYDTDVDQLDATLWTQSRFWLIANRLRNFAGNRDSFEHVAGQRDGLLVALALHAYHLERGRYPDTLAELVPAFLPAVPEDRVAGGAVLYKLVDGRPVIYSRGADGDDDGGRVVRYKNEPANERAARWHLKPGDTAADGDWVLFPPVGD